MDFQHVSRRINVMKRRCLDDILFEVIVNADNVRYILCKIYRDKFLVLTFDRLISGVFKITANGKFWNNIYHVSYCFFFSLDLFIGITYKKLNNELKKRFHVILD